MVVNPNNSEATVRLQYFQRCDKRSAGATEDKVLRRHTRVLVVCEKNALAEGLTEFFPDRGCGAFGLHRRTMMHMNIVFSL